MAWQAGHPLTIEEVDLAGRRAGGVPIEIKASAICRPGYYTLRGADHYMGTSTFANYIVVPEIAAAKICQNAFFNKGC